VGITCNQQYAQVQHTDLIDDVCIGLDVHGGREEVFMLTLRALCASGMA